MHTLGFRKLGFSAPSKEASLTGKATHNPTLVTIRLENAIAVLYPSCIPARETAYARYVSYTYTYTCIRIRSQLAVYSELALDKIFTSRIKTLCVLAPQIRTHRLEH